MPYRAWIIMTFPTHVIFRYHLPLSELKEKSLSILYVKLTTQGCLNFFDLPQVSTTQGVVHLSCEYLREKIRNGPNGILWGWGKTDLWKNLKSKISWHCLYKDTITGEKSFAWLIFAEKSTGKKYPYTWVGNQLYSHLPVVKLRLRGQSEVLTNIKWANEARPYKH
jgi:hypothetical protein